MYILLIIIKFGTETSKNMITLMIQCLYNEVLTYQLKTLLHNIYRFNLKKVEQARTIGPDAIIFTNIACSVLNPKQDATTRGTVAISSAANQEQIIYDHYNICSNCSY